MKHSSSAQVTDEQIEAYQIKTGRQRMDSTQVASNIRQMGRIQLLVTVIQRVPRMLSEEDREHYTETLAPYTQGHAGQYVYRLKGEEIGDHLQRIGTLMQQLLDELKPAYEDEPIYQVLERVFDEHFQMVEEAVRCKSNDQLSASSLQSPDDLEATYRNKRGQGYRGYTANITETCVHHGRITKEGSPFVRSAMTSAAQIASKVSPKWYGMYENLKPRCGKVGAKVAVARRLLGVIYYMWKRQQPYQENYRPQINEPAAKQGA